MRGMQVNKDSATGRVGGIGDDDLAVRDIDATVTFLGGLRSSLLDEVVRLIVRVIAVSAASKLHIFTHIPLLRCRRRLLRLCLVCLVYRLLLDDWTRRPQSFTASDNALGEVFQSEKSPEVRRDSSQRFSIRPEISIDAREEQAKIVRVLSRD